MKPRRTLESESSVWGCRDTATRGHFDGVGVGQEKRTTETGGGTVRLTGTTFASLYSTTLARCRVFNQVAVGPLDQLDRAVAQLAHDRIWADRRPVMEGLEPCRRVCVPEGVWGHPLVDLRRGYRVADPLPEILHHPAVDRVREQQGPVQNLLGGWTLAPRGASSGWAP